MGIQPEVLKMMAFFVEITQKTAQRLFLVSKQNTIQHRPVLKVGQSGEEPLETSLSCSMVTWCKCSFPSVLGMLKLSQEHAEQVVLICDEGYAGARCERVDLFYLRGDRGQILVICLIAVMVIFIILVVSICTCCHPLRKRRKRRKKEEEMETLGKDITPINDDIQETSIA
uniref:Betacellulin n=1 Tax=Bos mutus grunniens TaxID=30521 RepID=A0A8C0AFQ7_BOSMU